MLLLLLLFVIVSLAARLRVLIPSLCPFNLVLMISVLKLVL